MNQLCIDIPLLFVNLHDSTKVGYQFDSLYPYKQT